MRKQMLNLTKLGILEREREQDFPGRVTYALTEPGTELVEVARAAQTWLDDSPNGPHVLGSQAAKSSLKALVDGWSTTIVRVIAARTLALTQLDRLIASITYPTLERRLAAMRASGQIASCLGQGRFRPYTATPWLRAAVAPLAAAMEWERRFDAHGSVPPTPLDAESFFLLAVPEISLSPRFSGHVRLVAKFRKSDGEVRSAGAMVDIDAGVVTRCVARLEGHADAWASGSLASWLGASITGQPKGFEFGGDRELARAMVSAVYERFFQEGHQLLHSVTGDR